MFWPLMASLKYKGRQSPLTMPYGKKGVVVEVKVIDTKKEPNELDPGILKRIIVTVAEVVLTLVDIVVLFGEFGAVVSETLN